MEKLLLQDKDREITDQIPSQAKHTQFGKNQFNHYQLKYVWIVRKNNKKISTLSTHTLFPQGVQGWGLGWESPFQPLSVAPSSPHVQLPLHGHING